MGLFWMLMMSLMWHYTVASLVTSLGVVGDGGDVAWCLGVVGVVMVYSR